MAKKQKKTTNNKKKVVSEEKKVEKTVSKFAISFGIFNVILGILMLLAPAFISYSLGIFIGMVLLFVGLTQFALSFLGKGWKIVTDMIFGLITIFLGIFILKNLFQSVAVLTFGVAIYFLISGSLRIIEAFDLKPKQGWGLILTDGILTVILSFVILMMWPENSEVIIGILIGINLLVKGTVTIMVGLILKE